MALPILVGFFALARAIPTLPQMTSTAAAAQVHEPEQVVLFAPGLVSFEVTEAAHSDSPHAQALGKGLDRSPEAFLSFVNDEVLAHAFSSLEVTEVRASFVRPDRQPASPQEARLCRIYKARYSSSTPAPEAAGLIAASPAVLGASAVPVRYVVGLPNDPKFDMQWGFHQSGDFDMDLPEAWDVSVGDSTIVIAVVDTGLDRENPEFGGFSPERSGNVWVNRAEAEGTEGLDDDDNGLVDDIWGWDFVHYEEGEDPPWPGEDYLDEDNEPYDFHGHGTAVSGVAGALGNNGVGVAGMLWQCEIMGLRAGLAVQVGNFRVGAVRMDWCAGAIVYAVDMGASVINASWESGYYEGLDAAVDYAVSEGVVVVVAAGNRGIDPPNLGESNYLSSRGDCIDVGGVKKDGTRWAGSNWGSWVDLSAPASTVMTLGFRPPATREYWYQEGTSFAAPAVAAVAALVKHWHPSWTAEDVKAHLVATSTPLDPPDPTIGSGIVNAFRAITPARGGWSLALDGTVETPVMPVEGPEGVLALAAGLADGRAAGWSVGGGDLDGWPVAVGSEKWAAIASGDLDADGRSEVVLVDNGGLLAAVDLSGAVRATWEVGRAPVGEPVVVDLDADGDCEILLATEDSWINAWSGLGVALPGWPVGLSSVPAGAPAVGDVDGDGSLETVVACRNGAVHCVSQAGEGLPGWPVYAPATPTGPPSLGDIEGADGVPEVVVSGSDGLLYGWNSKGSELVGWPFRACDASAVGAVSLGDVDGDSLIEAAVACLGGRIVLCDGRGYVEEGWPVEAGGAVRGVLFADVDGDSSSDVIATVDGVGLCAWRSTGAAIVNWPKPTEGVPSAPASLGDFDADGRLELVAPSAAGWVHCWELSAFSYWHPASLWALPARTTGNTRLAALAAGVDVPAGGQGLGEPTPFRIAYVSASPNPFSGTTVIVSRLEGPKRAAYGTSIEIVDIAGRLVRKLACGPRGPGVYQDVWNGRDDSGRPTPSGVYVVRLRAADVVHSCRLVHLR